MAESHATDAEQAKTDAQAAQAAAEQAASSVSGLSAQIAQNTDDIADLVLSKAGVLIDTVSGSVASFVPDATVPTVKGLTVDIEPVQDLHGYDAPWPSGGGKNLWGDIVMANDMARTVGASINTTDKTVSITSGTGGNEANMTDGVVFKENTQYTFIFDGVVRGFGNLMFSYTDGTNDRNLGRYFSVGANVSAPGKTVAGLYKRNYLNTTVIYYEKAGLFEGALTASQFSPYSNICPISGWDSVDVHISPTQDAADGQTYTIPLGQTVYGGTVDAVKGQIVVNRAMVDMGTLNWSYVSGSSFRMRSTTSIDALLPETPAIAPNAISSIYPVLSYIDVVNTDKSLTIIFATSGAAGRVWVNDSSYSDAATFKTAMSGIQLVYELATPITISLTPTEISVLTGKTNNIWADSGDVEVEYAADLKTYIDQNRGGGRGIIVKENKLCTILSRTSSCRAAINWTLWKRPSNGTMSVTN